MAVTRLVDTDPQRQRSADAVHWLPRAAEIARSGAVDPFVAACTSTAHSTWLALKPDMTAARPGLEAGLDALSSCPPRRRADAAEVLLAAAAGHGSATTTRWPAASPTPAAAWARPSPTPTSRSPPGPCTRRPASSSTRPAPRGRRPSRSARTTPGSATTSSRSSSPSPTPWPPSSSPNRRRVCGGRARPAHPAPDRAPGTTATPSSSAPGTISTPTSPSRPPAATAPPGPCTRASAAPGPVIPGPRNAWRHCGINSARSPTGRPSRAGSASPPTRTSRCGSADLPTSSRRAADHPHLSKRPRCCYDQALALRCTEEPAVIDDEGGQVLSQEYRRGQMQCVEGA